jgi:hypothetical protein
MIKNNKFENFLNALHSTYLATRRFSYSENSNDSCLKQLELSISMIELYFSGEDKTAEFENICYNFGEENDYPLALTYWETEITRKSYIREDEEFIGYALSQLKELSLKSIKMIKSNEKHLKLNKLMDDVEYLVALMLESVDNKEWFKEYLNGILNPEPESERTKEESYRAMEELIFKSFKYGSSIKGLAQSFKISQKEVRGIIKKKEIENAKNNLEIDGNKEIEGKVVKAKKKSIIHRIKNIFNFKFK